MVKRLVEVFECDICGEEGTRYSVIFPEGTRTLDRCGRHNSDLEAMRQTPGEWAAPRSGKSTFRKSTTEDLRVALRAGKVPAQASGRVQVSEE